MKKLIAIAALAFAAGCGSDGGTAPTPVSLAGTWNLSTVNGSLLPFAIQTSNPKIEILNDQIIASASGTFTETGNGRTTTTTGVVSTFPFTDSGTWVVNGTAVSFRYNSDGSTGTGTVSANTFTVAADGFSQVYIKQ